jgi:lipopolysaccharide/colanic/teichoic acid biosynthesis glycosyltransferase
MIRVFRIHLPARTLLLAISEAGLSLALFTATILARRGAAWPAYDWGDSLLRVGAIVTIFVLSMYYYDLYDTAVLKSLREALTRLPVVAGTTCLLLALLYLAAPQVRLQVATVLVGMALAGLAVALVRASFLALARSPRLAERYILVGEGPLARALEREIERRPELGIRVAASLTARAGNSEDALRKTIAPLAAAGRIAGAIWAEENFPQGAPAEGIAGTRCVDGAHFYEIVTGKVWLDGAGERSAAPPGVSKAEESFRRFRQPASAAAAFLGLIVCAPLLAAVAIAVRLDSPGPAIFRQKRVGQHGRIFTLYKFRSMRAEPHGPFRPTEPFDSRLTQVGAWLRRTRLDELPQLWNICRGDMGFVGPRPFAWEEERRWAEEIPCYRRRWAVKPGATGWAQVHRGYCATREDNVEKLAYDLFYVRHGSVGLDLLILFQTTKILLQRRGAR